MEDDAIWKAAAWIGASAVAVASILATGNANLFLIFAFPFFACVLT